MSLEWKNKNESQWIALQNLPLDLRRMLTIQIREFVHQIEDVEPENTVSHNPRVLNFLERCYGKAA